MTRERAEALARDWLYRNNGPSNFERDTPGLANLLLRVADEEREECARVVEADAEQYIRTGYPVQEQLRKRAAAIRARAGQEDK